MSTYALRVGGPVAQCGTWLRLGSPDPFALLGCTPFLAKAMQFRSKTTAQRYRAKLLAILANKEMTLEVKKVKP